MEDKHKLIMGDISHLLVINAVELVSHVDQGKGVYSVFFIVPKRNGDARGILDLKWLNKYIRKRKFKMETIRSILKTIQKRDFLASLDLSEAYLHIPIRETHRKYFRFAYNGDHFQYRALPLGLKSSPRVFTKVLVTLIAHLRLQELALFPYLDNILRRATTLEQGEKAVHVVTDCLTKRGFLVNVEKSSLVPQQSIVHLGVRIETVLNSVFLTDERIQKLYSLHQETMGSQHSQYWQNY